MIKVIIIYRDEDLFKELEPFLKNNTIAISIPDETGEEANLFFKEEIKGDIIQILNKYPDYYDDGICNIYEYIEWFDSGGDWIEIGDKQFQKSVCIDSLIEKIKKDENIVSKIFKLKSDDIAVYINNLINKELLNIVDNYIKEIEQEKEKIRNGKFEGWN